jgi:hypothetical protein
MLLLSLVVQGGLTVFAQLRTAVSRVAQRAEGLETVRTIAWLLPAELSGGSPGRDWWVASGDSVSLRAFRGLGLVSPGFGGGAGMPVCYRGIRSPNPEKDSVLLLGRDGHWTSHDLVDRVRQGSGCLAGEGGWQEEWGLFPVPEEGVLARVFERGSYHLVDRAFRYRQGRGGRQPLTPEVISRGSFLGSSGEEPGLTWDLEIKGYVALGPPGFWRGVAW